MKKKSTKGKPIHHLVPSAEHTGAYQDKLNNPDHMQLSTADNNPSRSSTPDGGAMWGDPNNMAMSMPGGPI